MEEKVFQDNDELIKAKIANNSNLYKKKSFLTKRYKIKNLLRRNKKAYPFKYIFYFLYSLPLIFLLFVMYLLYIKRIKNAKLKSNSSLINPNKELKKSINLNREELFFDNITVSYEKAIPFIQKNVKGELDPISNSTNDTIILNDTIPLVSAIIPVYNSRNIIQRSIRSIQNQDMKNIEIILVNDFSTDDTLSFIESLQKEDQRIKIIKNQKNMGTLYSRSIGVLSAKGKYIFPLDNGDMFLDHNIFSTIYNIADKDSFDIVEFRCINSVGFSNINNNILRDVMFTNHPLNLVLTQPELGFFPIQPKNETGEISIEDNYLWNKCIKTTIYQKALNLFGEQRYSRFMTFNEDLIIVVLLFNVAESFKFIGKYGVLNVPNSGGGGTNQVTMNLYEMYILDTMIDFSKEFQKNKKIIVQYTIKLLGRERFDETLKDEENKKLFKSILDKIYECKLISQEDKDEIKKRSTNFIN